MNMFEFDFMQRAFIAGILVAAICPLIGSFLVVRRQSLIGDGLGHIAFAGVCAGWLMQWQPVISATIFTLLGALAIEKVRSMRSDFTDMVLAIFFYSGMALAIILASMQGSGGMSLSSFLFGSIVTVSADDLYIMAFLAICAFICVIFFYRQFVYMCFDEQAAKVSGMATGKLNVLLSVLTAMTIAVSMRIVGLLLVSAMMVIPVACSLPWKRDFAGTIILSVVFGLVCVVLGLGTSFYTNLAPGGTIVLTGAALFAISELWNRKK